MISNISASYIIDAIKATIESIDETGYAGYSYSLNGTGLLVFIDDVKMDIVVSRLSKGVRLMMTYTINNWNVSGITRLDKYYNGSTAELLDKIERICNKSSTSGNDSE